MTSSRGPANLAPVRDLVLQLVSATLVAAVLAAPMAVAWAVTRTSVQQTVGITPTNFSLTTAGRSELRLGVAGTLFIPRSRGPFGVVATVQGPGAPEVGDGQLASYVTPEMLRLYTGLFHDPEPALQEYVDVLARAVWHRLFAAELLLAAGGGLTLFALRLLVVDRGSPGWPGWPGWPGERAARRRVARTGAALVVALLASSTVAAVAMRPVEPRDTGVGSGEVHDLPLLRGSPAEGTTTNSPVVRLLLGGAVPKVQDLIRRQEEGARSFRETALLDLARQVPALTGPRKGERAVLVQSDMHCSSTMIALQKQVAVLLRGRYGDEVPALMAVAGDLTTNGTAAEGRCIKDEAAISQGAPIAAVTGNHESETSAEQMESAGMTVLSGSTTELGGISVLGAGDPARSELFGATHLRGDDTQAEVGERLYATAQTDRPDLLLVHEAYAAQAFIGVTDMTDFLDGRADPTTRHDDGIRDLPAGAVLYGHWHRRIGPRVVWNSDGTWTLVMELDTSGGAIDAPTIGRFSTPWSRPLQEASFPVLFLDEDSGLVTGYQTYLFAVDGSVSVRPRVDVGDVGDVGTLRTPS